MAATADKADGVTVPFLDLHPSHDALRATILDEIDRLLVTGAFTNGPHVAAFEEAFADYCGTAHCVGLASGLDALRLGLQALGLEPGDEVIIPANTFVATAEAVTQAGGSVVLADAHLSDYNIDVAAVSDALTPRTRYVLPVHLYGQLADVAALRDLSRRHDVPLVEDACQAHGAQREGVAAGTAGSAAAFSFYPGKNLGAMGDAGALVTDSESLAERVRALREHGQRTKYHHDWIGWTARLDTVQAAALLHKLPHLPRWNRERQSAAAFYLERLNGLGDLALPSVATASEPVWHLFVVRTSEPERLAEFLRQRGIGSGRHYPQPIHLTGAYQSLGYHEGDFPVAETLARECLSLPIFPGISEAQLAAVCAAVSDYFAGG